MLHAYLVAFFDGRTHFSEQAPELANHYYEGEVASQDAFMFCKGILEDRPLFSKDDMDQVELLHEDTLQYSSLGYAVFLDLDVSPPAELLPFLQFL